MSAFYIKAWAITLPTSSAHVLYRELEEEEIDSKPCRPAHTKCSSWHITTATRYTVATIRY